MRPEDYDIWVDRFLREELREEELASFLQQVKEDDNLRIKLAEMKALQASVRKSSLKKKMNFLQEVEKEYEGSDSSTRKNKGRSLWWFLGGVLLACLLAYFLWPQKPAAPSEKYAAFFEEDYISTIQHKTMRSTVQTDSLSRDQRYAYNLYAGQLYEDAIPFLRDLWEENRDTLAYYYLGYSYLGIGEDDQGEQILDQVKHIYEKR